MLDEDDAAGDNAVSFAAVHYPQREGLEMKSLVQHFQQRRSASNGGGGHLAPFGARRFKPRLEFRSGDLAPGDRRSAALDLSPLKFDVIRSAADPLFEEAYGHLWLEFGARHEMESRGALRQRFDLAPRIVYEMIYVQRDEEFVAARDHTIILGQDDHHAIVHLSHNLVTPSARRTGLAGWLRALPVCGARECLAANGTANGSAASSAARITLVSEMEHPFQDDPHGSIRLRAYEKAGFRKIDPSRIAYHQPDFREPGVIDSTGGPRPLPFQLIIRRVGREHERAISGAETRTLVQALYDVYGPQFRPEDMAHPLLSLDSYPADDATVALILPTQ